MWRSSTLVNHDRSTRQKKKKKVMTEAVVVLVSAYQDSGSRGNKNDNG